MAEKCTATSKQTGSRCGNWALPGTVVCKFHGGLAPQVRAAAERRLAEQRIVADAEKARDLLRAEGVEDPVDVDAEFSRLIHEACTFKDVLAHLVEQLRDLEVTNNFNSSELRAVVAAYERAIDRTGRLLTDYGRLNLSERRTRVAEAQAQAIAAVVTAALEAATDDPVAVQRGQGVAASKLLELGPGRG